MLDDNPKPSGEDRRDFLKKCGTFAAVTPPAVTFLLSTSMSSKAIAASSGRPGHGFGDPNHDHWGPPGQVDSFPSKPEKNSFPSKPEKH
jgi:hypothetical protein